MACSGGEPRDQRGEIILTLNLGEERREAGAEEKETKENKLLCNYR